MKNLLRILLLISLFSCSKSDPQPIELCVPILTVPEDGAIQDNGCDQNSDLLHWSFDWTTCDGATLYNLYVYRVGAEFPVINTEIDVAKYENTEIAYVVPRNQSNWKWKVRAKINGNWGEWSEERTFNFEELCLD